MRSELKDRVENILRGFPETRNSDTTLILYVWNAERYDVMSVKRLRELITERPPAQIVRYRAYFQNTLRQHLPTIWAVAKARGWQEQNWKIQLGYSVSTPGDREEERQQKQHLQQITQSKLI